jgi:hypothetical protein
MVIVENMAVGYILIKVELESGQKSGKKESLKRKEINNSILSKASANIGFAAIGAGL